MRAFVHRSHAPHVLCTLAASSSSTSSLSTSHVALFAVRCVECILKSCPPMCNTANIRDFSRAQAIHTIKTQLINNVPRMPTTPCARWPTANKWSISMQRRRRRRRVWNTITQPVWRICCAGAHRKDLCANVCKFVHVSRTQAVAFTWSAHVRTNQTAFT